MRGEVNRKVRSDRKVDIKPTLNYELKEVIYSLSYITNKPVKDVAESIIIFGLDSKKVMEYLSQNFRRDYMQGSVMYIGNLDNLSVQKERIVGKKQRITIRLKQGAAEEIKHLAFALDVTPSRAAAVLLDGSIRNSNFINKYLNCEKYVR